MPHPNRRLGRQPRAHGNLPHYSQLRRASAEVPIPAAHSWLTGMPGDLGMMLNDTLGDCTCAGLHHARQVWTFNGAGAEITDPDADVLADYERFCGYRPGRPDTDRGGRLQDVLGRASRLGLSAAAGPDRPLSCVELDPRQPGDVRRAIHEGGCAYIGIDIPRAWSETAAGGVWDATTGPAEGGHCVILAGYDPGGFEVVSWGLRFRLTEAGFAQACDEAYWLLDRAWLGRQGATPCGLDVAAIEAMMRGVQAG